MGATWPAAGSESHPWDSDYSPGRHSRSAQRRHRGPYSACVPAVIALQPVDVSPAVLAAAAEAATEIARFDSSLGGEIAPFAAVLLRSESAASSKIEKLTASARALAEAELGTVAGSNAVEIVGNVKAMTAAIALADDVSVETIRLMHHALLADLHPAIAGAFRTQQVWIGGGDLGPHHAVFVPPHHARIAEGLDDLVAFIDRVDIPVLIQAAVAHAQFETIHPFVDGNGRTGRALVHAFLTFADLTRNVTVPISAGLLADTERYFSGLAAYRVGDIEPIVEAFTSASYAAIENGTILVMELRGARAAWDSQIKARSHSRTWAIAGLLLRQPVINAAYVARELAIDPDNVHRLIEPLVAADILVPSSTRKGGRLWRAPAVLEALDAFAERAGRRSGDVPQSGSPDLDSGPQRQRGAVRAGRETDPPDRH